ncbi:hypothetical protein FZC79_07630 [Rossellomorea vietnamensis]|uniref:Uncharacterized protein n=1 Tax=Rossellomorea vietnamensis TaxID=218284 RepID=A0A5D4KH37_9BACI|nr:hypothetical protein [Rossellomorea vietnamensis]TYR76015.1 hypothetical protein FZC79_07630 [Rossellomorea vietnamensis]
MNKRKKWVIGILSSLLIVSIVILFTLSSRNIDKAEDVKPAVAVANNQESGPGSPNNKSDSDSEKDSSITDSPESEDQANSNEEETTDKGPSETKRTEDSNTTETNTTETPALPKNSVTNEEEKKEIDKVKDDKPQKGKAKNQSPNTPVTDLEALRALFMGETYLYAVSANLDSSVKSVEFIIGTKSFKQEIPNGKLNFEKAVDGEYDQMEIILRGQNNEEVDKFSVNF